MEKSWRDLEMAHRAEAGTPPFYDMAVYHCQQSGEKAVKALLVLRGISFEKPHDIEVLRAESSRVSGGGGVGPEWQLVKA
jgi:HEPN domain-containing protein